MGTVLSKVWLDVADPTEVTTNGCTRSGHAGSWSLEAVRGNTRHSPDAVTMLGQRRRRWTNIVTALGECL